MRRIVALICFVVVVSPPLANRTTPAQEGTVMPEDTVIREEVGSTGIGATGESTVDPLQGVTDSLQGELEGPLDATEIAAANQWVSSLGIAEWLGPLAPVALSPFFGVTCLSGLSLWGPESVTNNALIGQNSVLRSQMLFWIFLALTLLTSIPRLTKVSKPFAQAVDRLEAYSVIVILLAVKFAASQTSGEPEIAMIQLGIFSFTADALLAIAMVINILVINSVKFFFEFMVWLTPIPLLDALFEVCNKSICAALISVYAFSPTIATVINLCLLFVAFCIFRWVSRRVRFYRTMLLDPVLAWLWPSHGRTDVAELIVFPDDEIGPFPPKARLKLYRGDTAADGWTLEEASWWRPDREVTIPSGSKPRVKLGWIINRIDFAQPDGELVKLCLSRRFDGAQLSEIIEELGMQLPEMDAQLNTGEMNAKELNKEFA